MRTRKVKLKKSRAEVDTWCATLEIEADVTAGRYHVIPSSVHPLTQRDEKQKRKMLFYVSKVRKMFKASLKVETVHPFSTQPCTKKCVAELRVELEVMAVELQVVFDLAEEVVRLCQN